MNLPPSEYIRVPFERMRSFVAAMSVAAGLSEGKANLLADLLTTNDLRGVFSHGTQRLPDYARLLRGGQLNPRPEPWVVQETPLTVTVDGDGGLGYFAAHQATQAAIAKTETQGITVALTRNHGHIGAAGIYARMTLGHDLLTFVTSGHQLRLEPGQDLFDAAGGSPFAFSAPAGEEDSLVLDFGTMHDLYPNDPQRDELARIVPGLVLRHIGMGEICQAWGGFLAGIPADPRRAEREYAGANQGALLIAIKISLFLPPQQFRREMDEYARRVRQLKPLQGFEESFLAGAVEARRERAWREEGIPVGPEHRKRLEQLGMDMDVLPPW